VGVLGYAIRVADICLVILQVQVFAWLLLWNSWLTPGCKAAYSPWPRQNGFANTQVQYGGCGMWWCSKNAWSQGVLRTRSIVKVPWWGVNRSHYGGGGGEQAEMGVEVALQTTRRMTACGRPWAGYASACLCITCKFWHS
jgi:hypothetical protein